MLVRIQDLDTGEIMAESADLADAFPDAGEDRDRAERALAQTGEYRVGGGAAPLMLLTAVAVQ